jgi:hypothetical protein
MSNLVREDGSPRWDKANGESIDAYRERTRAHGLSVQNALRASARETFGPFGFDRPEAEQMFDARVYMRTPNADYRERVIGRMVSHGHGLWHTMWIESNNHISCSCADCDTERRR